MGPSQNIVSIVIQAFDETADGFTRPIQNMKDMQAAASALANVMVAAGATAVGALALLTDRAITSAAAMGRMSEVAGMTVEDFSKMAIAAGLSGVNLDTFASGVNKLNKSMVETTTNAASPAAKAFDTLGISVKNADGTLKTNEQVLLEVAQAFHTHADGAEKSALAIAIFGRGGASMIPMLNEGKDALEELTQSSMGVTTASADMARQFQQNEKILNGGFASIGKTIASTLLPYLVEYSDEMVRSSKESGVFVAIAMTVVDVLKGMAVAVDFVWTILKSLGTIIGTQLAVDFEILSTAVKTTAELFSIFGTASVAVQDALGKLSVSAKDTAQILVDMFSGNYSKAVSDGAGLVAKNEAVIKQLGETMKQVFTDAKNVVIGNSAQAASNITAMYKQAAADIKKDWTALADFSLHLFTPVNVPVNLKAPAKPQFATPALDPIENKDQTAKQLADMQKIEALQKEMLAGQLDGLQKLNAEEDVHYQKRLADIAKLKQEAATSTTSDYSDILKLNALEEQAEVEHQARLQKIKQDYEDKFQKDADGLQIKGMAAGYQRDLVQAANEYQIEKDKLAKEYGDSEEYYTLLNSLDQSYLQNKKNINDQAASSFASSLGSMASAFQSYGKAGFEAAKQISVAQAIINTYEGATKALAQGGIFGGVLAAIVIATGMAQVATIESTSYSGKAHAGITSVPGAGDQTWVLQGGERVVQSDQNKDLTNFLAGGGSGGGSTHVVNLQLDGKTLGQVVYSLSRNGQLTVHPRGVVSQSPT